jgi:hypothetical protein
MKQDFTRIRESGRGKVSSEVVRCDSRNYTHSWVKKRFVLLKPTASAGTFTIQSDISRELVENRRRPTCHTEGKCIHVDSGGSLQLPIIPVILKRVDVFSP